MAILDYVIVCLDTIIMERRSIKQRCKLLKIG